MLLILDRSVMTKYILLALSARGRYAFRSYRDKTMVKGKQTEKGMQEVEKETCDEKMFKWALKVTGKQLNTDFLVCGVCTKSGAEINKAK